MAKTIYKVKPRQKAGLLHKAICETRRRLIVIPIIVEPIVVPVPTATIPVEVSDIQVAI